VEQAILSPAEPVWRTHQYFPARPRAGGGTHECTRLAPRWQATKIARPTRDATLSSGVVEIRANSCRTATEKERHRTVPPLLYAVPATEASHRNKKKCFPQREHRYGETIQLKAPSMEFRIPTPRNTTDLQCGQWAESIPYQLWPYGFTGEGEISL
jgi:hypothetical protein